MNLPTLALDVDGVLANFSEGCIDKAYEMGLGEAFPSGWREVRSWGLSNRFSDVMRTLWGNTDFWMGLHPLPGARKDVQPGIYLTSRPIPSDVTEAWLRKYGFPEAPVVTVQRPTDKLAVLKARGLWLIDDHHVTVEECIVAGVEAYLFKAPYQRGHDVSHLPTITTIQEAIDKYEGRNRVNGRSTNL